MALPKLDSKGWPITIPMPDPILGWCREAIWGVPDPTVAYRLNDVSGVEAREAVYASLLTALEAKSGSVYDVAYWNDILATPEELAETWKTVWRELGYTVEFTEGDDVPSFQKQAAHD